MEINTQKTPQAVLDAVLNPSPLSVGRIALLEKAKSPLLMKDFGNLNECIRATYLVELPLKEAVAKLKDEDTLLTEAIAWADELGWDKYEEKLAALIVSLVKFWKMLPPEETEKKTAEISPEG